MASRLRRLHSILATTGATATEVNDLPVEPDDLMYTLYTKFGIDAAREFQSSVKAAHGGQMIPGLFA